MNDAKNILFYYLSGDFLKVTEELNKANIEDSGIDIIMLKGITYLRMQKFEAAIKCFNLANFWSNGSYFDLFLCYIKILQGLNEDALYIAEDCLDEREEDFTAYCLKGIAFYNLNLLEKSKFCLNHANMFADYKCDLVHLYLFKLSFKLKDYKNTIKYLSLYENAKNYKESKLTRYYFTEVYTL